MDGVRGGDGGFLSGALAVHEDRDVLTDVAPFVHHPPSELGVRPLEGVDHLADGRTLDLELARSVGQVPQGRTKAHHRHAAECTRRSDSAKLLTWSVLRALN